MAEPIVVERRIAARPDRVYDYLSAGSKWAMWQGVGAEIDPRPGGIFALEMANGMRARGQFVVVEPPRRVVFTWGWVDHPSVPPGSSTVEIELIPDADGTVVRLTHTGLPPEELGLHRQGWDHYLPRLEAAVIGPQ